MLCFVYCEWIDEERLKRAMPSAKRLAKVTLDDHRLVFTAFVEDAADKQMVGGCHLEPASGQRVPGVLYELDSGDVAVAESLSRVAEGRYAGAVYLVRDDSGQTYTATAYIIKHPLEPTRPTDEYRQHMLKGGREHGFPETYLTMLQEM